VWELIARLRIENRKFVTNGRTDTRYEGGSMWRGGIIQQTLKGSTRKKERWFPHVVLGEDGQGCYFGGYCI